MRASVPADLERRGWLRALVFWLLIASRPLSAQWIDYPTPDLPRTGHGAPDLKAKAPRTPAGRPDLSGIWYAAETLSAQRLKQAPLVGLELMAAAFGPNGPGRVLLCAEGDDCISQQPGPIDLTNLGRQLPGATLPYQPWARELVVQRMRALFKEDPHARCLPPNFPRAFSFPQHWKLVQTPKLIVLLHEFNASYRQILLDGRPLPTDPQPTWNGYSVGHWERDTLVVESIGFRDDLWLDLIGSPLTSAARVTERFRRPDYGTLRIEITVDDPKAYTQPWTVTLDQRLVPDTELLDEICLENERSTRLFERE